MTNFGTHQSDAGTRGSEISQDVAFDLLSSRLRRDVLRYLVQDVDVLELRSLADQLLVWDETGEDDIEEICIALHHVHLPKLEDAGLITYDSNQRRIECQDAVDSVAPYLDFAVRDDLRE